MSHRWLLVSVGTWRVCGDGGGIFRGSGTDAALLGEFEYVCVGRGSPERTVPLDSSTTQTCFACGTDRSNQSIPNIYALVRSLIRSLSTTSGTSHGLPLVLQVNNFHHLADVLSTCVIILIPSYFAS